MAVMAAKGPKVFCSEEVELLAYRKAIEFAVDVGFSKLVIEVDNSSAMTVISTLKIDQSLSGECGWGYSTFDSKFALGKDRLY